MAKKVKLERIHRLNFYKVTAAPMVMHGRGNWALNRSGRRKPQTGVSLEIHLQIMYALRIYAVEGRNQDYKNKLHHHILRMES
jgi:hypothetical protein